jgi:dihydroneopterin aldolase/2-amino-4-hydroxy-6-hydroxymethyldihydropteridine diphosphokinase
MTDQIQIKDLLLRAIIGINEEERRDRQDVLINVVLYADTRKAGASDELEDAVNYRTITKRIIELVENSRFYLVEKMAAEVAAICLEDPRAERARVRVEKPGALRFARSVGVEIERSQAGPGWPNRAFISLGSNIEPEQNLREAVARLSSRCRLLAVSRVYETAPVGKTDQPNFLNAAAELETELEAAQLKEQVLKQIEQELGRVRTQNRNAPRTIDLDISLFNDQVLRVGRRHIPDPEILERAYLAWPLADLAPDYRHPETGQTLLEIAQSLPASDVIRRVDLALEPEYS